MNEQKFNDVLELMANGLSLRKAMLQVGVLNGSFFHYVNTVDGAVEQYARARASLLEYWAQDTVEMADACLPGQVIKETKDGTFVEVSDNVSRSKLMVDTRKWMLSKLMPKVYSDKLALTGEEGGPLRILALSKDDVDL